MRVTKASQAGEETRLGPEELEQINRLARRELTAEEVRRRLLHILPGAPGRAAMLQGYDELAAKLGQPGAPRRAAADIVQLLRAKHSSL